MLPCRGAALGLPAAAGACLQVPVRAWGVPAGPAVASPPVVRRAAPPEQATLQGLALMHASPLPALLPPAGDGVVGVLTVGSCQAHAFDEQWEDTVDVLAVGGGAQGLLGWG